ncbi:Molybdenum cofactor biosynthesis enzyme MoaA [Methanonatronarchaeum thermophilum]|uniref:Probable GTP 3',8-cyclase n=1 Tax=Methanonatronarchaeum thermophilum TaxID=1927129 RepID=A0A1Y3GAC5_9EURY|nr:GTP 3',8-cyclase MoaA [Methanonatronarchaeum thermophilum]OUJ18369.1 Molybdenum cofactor biosynthesis enzyme MoaA [Methanonatronarchaeum thermophilum]
MACSIEDRYGREITNLRFSLTQACNLDCIYCHNEGENGDRCSQITQQQIVEAVKLGNKYGIEKVKLSGGEPLLRPDLTTIIKKISPYLKDLSLTTNAILLPQKIDELYKAGLNRVNISLDSLNPSTYRDLTGGGNLKKALKGIDAAEQSDLYPVKINTVLLNTLNTNEIKEFINYAKNKDIILQFIEYHDTNTLQDQENYSQYHYNIDPIEKQLKNQADQIETRRMHHRKKYYIDNAEIEVVRPMHNTEFCENCTRLRVTSCGEFKPCLMREDNHIPFKKDMEKALLKAINQREPYF